MKIQSFEAAQGYNLAKSKLRMENVSNPTTQPAADAKSPGDAAFESIHSLTQTVAQAEKTTMAYMSQGADPHSVVEAIAAAELAVETAVTIRDKVVEAYQELIRMPI